jgi:hypothetical protein
MRGEGGEAKGSRRLARRRGRSCGRGGPRSARRGLGKDGFSQVKFFRGVFVKLPSRSLFRDGGGIKVSKKINYSYFHELATPARAAGLAHPCERELRTLCPSPVVRATLFPDGTQCLNRVASPQLLPPFRGHLSSYPLARRHDRAPSTPGLPC